MPLSLPASHPAFTLPRPLPGQGRSGRDDISWFITVYNVPLGKLPARQEAAARPLYSLPARRSMSSAGSACNEWAS